MTRPQQNEIQLLDIGGVVYAVRASARTVDRLENEQGLWTCVGTAHPVTLAEAKRIAATRSS